MPVAKLWRVLIKSDSAQTLRDCLKSQDLDIGCCRSRNASANVFEVEALVTETQLEQLKTLACEVEILENASEKGQRRMREIGTTDRFARALGKVPRGLGRKE